ncbi:Fe-S protein assembly co-chaperone HscB [Pasteurellaceae bacterium HPA106]|uniref:Fe-S protein assembly co-chaperone HscB n=1 Tax=Spirabiliibacterium pneumoniae TaxID=221400 RepID=UPI001AAC702E|nr:Fe-S protein assembly co-chaperone HscB [Spirabiliibacterium pneumoniae]MBE2896188.1 Fe-S protein assembly co-chaperone HscB [Spirabiliibacterium pneumoniae]
MQNPFELFELPLTFKLDLNALNARYLALQKAHHPDNFATASKTDQLNAVQRTADINEAYHTLKSPLLRAQALLQWAGGDTWDGEQTVHDSDFLLSQLSLREQLMEVEQSRDETALCALRDENDKIYVEALRELESAVDQRHWSEAKRFINRLKFIEKFQRDVDAVEEQFYD